jgi:hypothetical protein
MGHTIYSIKAYEYGESTFRVGEAFDEVLEMIEDAATDCCLYEFTVEQIETWAARTTHDDLRKWLLERVAEARAGDSEYIYIGSDSYT